MIKVKILKNKICICYYKNGLLYSMTTGDSLECALNSLQDDLRARYERVGLIDGYLEKGFYRQGIRVLEEFEKEIENSNIFLKLE